MSTLESSTCSRQLLAHMKHKKNHRLPLCRRRQWNSSTAAHSITLSTKLLLSKWQINCWKRNNRFATTNVLTCLCVIVNFYLFIISGRGRSYVDFRTRALKNATGALFNAHNDLCVYRPRAS